MEAMTVEKHGRKVLARVYGGQPVPMTYANRSQAAKKAAQLGPDWAVYQWGRPFYVAQMTPEERAEHEAVLVLPEPQEVSSITEVDFGDEVIPRPTEAQAFHDYAVHSLLAEEIMEGFLVAGVNPPMFGIRVEADMAQNGRPAGYTGALPVPGGSQGVQPIDKHCEPGTVGEVVQKIVAYLVEQGWTHDGTAWHPGASVHARAEALAFARMVRAAAA